MIRSESDLNGRPRRRQSFQLLDRQTKTAAPPLQPLIINLHCVEVVQPLLLLSIESLRLLSAASPLLFRPPMNTLVTCVFRVRSDIVVGDGRQHGDDTVTWDAAPGSAAAAPTATSAGCGRGRLRDVMTLIMTFFAPKTVLPFRPSVRPRPSVVFSIRPLHHHGISEGRAAVQQETGQQDGDRPPQSRVLLPPP